MIKFVGFVTSMQIVVSVDFHMGKFLWSEEVRGMLKEQKIQCSGKKSCTSTHMTYLKTTENMLLVFTCQLCFVTGSIVWSAKCRYLVLAAGGNFNVFSPIGATLAPMKVKFWCGKWTKSRLFRAKFHPHQRMGGRGAKKPRTVWNFYQISEYKCLLLAYPVPSCYEILMLGHVLKFREICSRQFQFVGIRVPKNFQRPMAAKLCVGPHAAVLMPLSDHCWRSTPWISTIWCCIDPSTTSAFCQKLLRKWSIADSQSTSANTACCRFASRLPPIPFGENSCGQHR